MDMPAYQDFLFLFGVVIICGFIGGKLSNRLRFPAVIGYIAAGIFIGPSVFGLVSIGILDRMGMASEFALVFLIIFTELSSLA